MAITPLKIIKWNYGFHRNTTILCFSNRYLCWPYLWPFSPYGQMANFVKMTILNFVKMTINMGKIGVYSNIIQNVALLWKPKFHLMIFKGVMAKLKSLINCSTQSLAPAEQGRSYLYFHLASVRASVRASVGCHIL